jgi:hypothetical protein
MPMQASVARRATGSARRAGALGQLRNSAGAHVDAPLPIGAHLPRLPCDHVVWSPERQLDGGRGPHLARARRRIVVAQGVIRTPAAEAVVIAKRVIWTPFTERIVITLGAQPMISVLIAETLQAHRLHAKAMMGKPATEMTATNAPEQRFGDPALPVKQRRSGRGGSRWELDPCGPGGRGSDERDYDGAVQKHAAYRSMNRHGSPCDKLGRRPPV